MQVPNPLSSGKDTAEGKVSSMINSIKYFEEKCISKFEKLEDDFMKEPTKLVYVYEVLKTNHQKGKDTVW